MACARLELRASDSPSGSGEPALTTASPSGTGEDVATERGFRRRSGGGEVPAVSWRQGLWASGLEGRVHMADGGSGRGKSGAAGRASRLCRCGGASPCGLLPALPPACCGQKLCGASSRSSSEPLRSRDCRLRGRRSLRLPALLLRRLLGEVPRDAGDGCRLPPPSWDTRLVATGDGCRLPAPREAGFRRPGDSPRWGAWPSDREGEKAETAAAMKLMLCLASSSHEAVLLGSEVRWRLRPAVRVTSGGAVDARRALGWEACICKGEPAALLLSCK
mmetsp:Transcript_26136/g.73182  ORF Transcript_26136/g.73182 Transcript_26136/m.73182 type:complete len:276 (+) Transcript_26136:1169-1996(+)